jgi:hypothetical protein
MKNDYEIRGDVTVIFLDRKDGTRLECLIDTVDLPRAMEISGTWLPQYRPDCDICYVSGKNKRQSYWLHRFLLNIKPGFEVDHIDHNGLNNCRSNLRIVTRGQNMQNRKGAMKKNKSSGIRGVSWDKKIKRWVVTLKVDGVKYHFGCYKDLDEATDVAQRAIAGFMPYSTEAMALKNKDFEIPEIKSRKPASSGIPGIYYQDGKWRVRPNINGKRTEIGMFADLEEAKRALFNAMGKMEAII